MKTQPHLMLEAIWKDGYKSFTNSSIIPDMMNVGEIVDLTGKYEFHPLEVMEEVMKDIMWQEHGIDLDSED